MSDQKVEALVQIEGTFAKCFKARDVQVEPFILEYLKSITIESLERATPLIKALEDLLVCYDAVEDELEAASVCEGIEKQFGEVFVLKKLKKQLSDEKGALDDDDEKDGEALLSAPIKIGESSDMFKAKRERTLRKDRIITVNASTLVKEKKDRKQAVIEAKKALMSEKEDGVSASALNVSSAVMMGTNASGKSKTINLSDVTLNPIDGGSPLLDNAAIRIVDGRRYGLIGRNGVGKTTLLRAMAKGEIKGFPDHLRIVHVQQEIVGTDQLVLDVVMSADIVVKELIEEEKRLSELKDGDGDEEAGLRLQEVHQQMEELDAWTAEARACGILSGLQFTDDMIRKYRTRDLSGGWRMRVALASALFVNPDLLLLDEPTNHLDFPAVIWLEGFLQKFGKTVIIVSHDRFFLNNVVTDIMHFQNQNLTYYRGDYSTFEKVRTEKMRQQAKSAESAEKKKQHMQAFIDRFRYNANRAALVQSRIKTLNKLAASSDFLEELMEDPAFRFEFPTPEPLGKEIITVDNVEFGYGDNPSLLKNINLRLDMESRIAVLGKNGAGKTTLLKLFTGELAPRQGIVNVNKQARIAMFAQHHVDQLNLTMTPHEYLQFLHPDVQPQDLRNHLGRYGMSGLAMRPIGKLSGGQKNRVSFAAVTWGNPHLLILDEPTNHCDLETVDALIFAISVFQGGVIAVSHDQHFMSSCTTEFWAVAEKTVNVFFSFNEAKSFTYRRQLVH
eukprot:TRINITY_DN2470_c0_g1_i1.p1 TRINITY_DN2470_c0_g1~~TRINITY_DN2470_c0_g1_i1.p1  ORF type:complete len:729 (+),score=225.89 TRINITY_DN2470_c0_g1_i1:40-2226(+)